MFDMVVSVYRALFLKLFVLNLGFHYNEEGYSMTMATLIE